MWTGRVPRGEGGGGYRTPTEQAERHAFRPCSRPRNMWNSVVTALSRLQSPTPSQKRMTFVGDTHGLAASPLLGALWAGWPEGSVYNNPDHHYPLTMVLQWHGMAWHQMAMKLETVPLARTTMCMGLGVFVVGWVPLGKLLLWSTTPRNVTCHSPPHLDLPQSCP